MKTVYAYPEIADLPDADPFADDLPRADEVDLAEWDAAFPGRQPTDAELQAMEASFFGYDLPCCLCRRPMAGEPGLAHDYCAESELSDLRAEGRAA